MCNALGARYICFYYGQCCQHQASGNGIFENSLFFKKLAQKRNIIPIILFSGKTFNIVSHAATSILRRFLHFHAKVRIICQKDTYEFRYKRSQHLLFDLGTIWIVPASAVVLISFQTYNETFSITFLPSFFPSLVVSSLLESSPPFNNLL